MVVWIEIYNCKLTNKKCNVTTCVVVWIEIKVPDTLEKKKRVTTCVVVWIEIWQRSKI